MTGPSSERTARVFDMDAHNGWGNRISWNDFEKRRIDGHMTPKPREGDEIRCTMESGQVARFRVLAVEHVTSVPDMFYATVEDIGYVDSDAPPVTRFGVFGEVLA